MDCNECEYYDKEDNYCTAFECNGIDCPQLPCEAGEAFQDELKNF